MCVRMCVCVCLPPSLPREGFVVESAGQEGVAVDQLVHNPARTRKGRRAFVHDFLLRLGVAVVVHGNGDPLVAWFCETYIP